MIPVAHLALLAVLTIASADRLQSRVDAEPEEPTSTAQVLPAVLPNDSLEQLAWATWPEDRTAALIILHCESRTGDDPDAWRTDRPDGGPYQINRASWERFFFLNHGWTWDEITYDPVINTAAARIIYDRTGDWSAWSCEDSLAPSTRD